MSNVKGHLSAMWDGGNITLLNENMSRSFYRGRNLGAAFTTEQAEAIAAGDFSDFFNGDYWDDGTRVFRIVDNTNWYLRRGDQGNGFDKPHLVIMTDDNILKDNGSTTQYMATSNTTSTGYNGTRYRSTYRSQCKSVFTNFFGTDHVASYRGLLSAASANGRTSTWAWYDCDVELPTEDMMFGSSRWGDGAGNGYGGGSFHGQMMLFRLDPRFIIATQRDGIRENSWEQNVCTASNFALVAGNGGAAYGNASYTNVGLRPFALII